MPGNTFVTAVDPPIPATHSSLDYFQPSNILVDLQRGIPEEVFTITSPDGPVLEFEFQGPKTEIGGSVLDLRNTFLKLEVQMKFVGQTKGDPNEKVVPSFANNLMHSLFHNLEVLVNGVTVSTSNNLYPYKALLEAELSHNKGCKDGWLRCQGYEYEMEPGDLDGASFTGRSKLASSLTGAGDIKGRWHYYGRLSDTFLCETDNFLLPGVTVRIRLYRSPEQFVLIHGPGAEDSMGNFTLQITNATLHVQKIELKNETFLSIEKALLQKPAAFDFREVVPKSFLISDGVTLYFKDDLFNRAPISRLVLAMVSETSFSGSLDSNPFNFQQFDLETVRLYREGSLVGATPLNMNDNLVRAYYTTLKAIGFEHGGNGISLHDFRNHFCLCFQLTADLRIKDNTIRPELTGARLSIELKFKSSTRAPIRLILLGERRSIVLIDRNREVIKNSSVYNG